MAFRSRSLLAAALGVCVAHSPLALAEGPPAEAAAASGFHAGDALRRQPSQNQQTADLIAGQLRQSAALHGYDVEVAFQNGVARLTGTVADQPQRAEVLRIIPRRARGSERVLDRLSNGNVVQAGSRLDEPPLWFPLPTPVHTAVQLQTCPFRNRDRPSWQ